MKPLIARLLGEDPSEAYNAHKYALEPPVFMALRSRGAAWRRSSSLALRSPFLLAAGSFPLRTTRSREGGASSSAMAWFRESRGKWQ